MDFKKQAACLRVHMHSSKETVESFKNDKNGFLKAVNQVIGLGLVAIILILMVMVFAKIDSSTTGSMPACTDYRNQTSACNALWAAQNVSANTYSGFQLASITPTVMAAGVVIMVILSFVGYMYFGAKSNE